VQHILKFSVAIAILSWLFRSGKIDFDALKAVWSPLPCLILLTLVSGSYFAITIRWRELLRSQKMQISSFQAFRLTLIGLFFNFALPGGVSGDLVKAYYIARDQEENRWAAGISVVLDRFIGITAMIFMALVMMIIDHDQVFANPTLESMFYSILGLFIFCLTFAHFLFSPEGYNSKFMQTILKKFEHQEKMQRFFKVGHRFGANKKVLLKTLALSLAGQITCTLMFIYAGNLMDSDIPWTTYFYCVPIGMMLTAIPISPGGVGVGQAAFYFLFNLYTGRKSELGPTLMTIYQMFSFALGIVGALFYLQYKSEVSHAKQA
jgi:uncharacterized protein (TIRG00374 family)